MKHSRTTYRRTSSIIAALLLTAAAVGVTRGDPYGVGGPDAGFFPDSSLHTYCLGFSIVAADLDEVAVWAMNNSLAPTDEPVGSPKELAAIADLVVVGHIRSVADGRVQMADSERPLSTAVFAVSVSAVLVGAQDSILNGLIYFEVLRPGKLEILELERRLPEGEVVLFLADRTSVDGVDNSSAGRPTGARLYAPYAQGFWIAGDADAVSVYVEDLAELPDGWAGLDTIPELLDSLAD